MPKEVFTIDRFAGMTPSMKIDGCLPLVQGARIDISPNLVQEFDDALDTGTVFTDYKTMTVNGTEHTIGITTAGKIVVDGVSYNGLGTDNVGNAKIDVFNNCALIIDPNNNNVPAKIVTFPENVADSVVLSDDDTVIVEDDTMHSYGSLSDIKRFIVLNDYMALVLFAGASKLCFFILQDIGTSYNAGEVIDCQEHEYPIIDFAPHYVEEDVDYAVFAYYNDGNALCFGRYNIASWFTSGSHTHTSFLEIDPVTDMLPVFLTCGTIPLANGYEFVAMAVTLDKLYWQYLSVVQAIAAYTGSPEEDEDILYSIRLTNFTSLPSGSNTISCYETAWETTDIQKSKLPLYVKNAYDASEITDTIYIASGIAILNYATNTVGLFIEKSNRNIAGYPKLRLFCTWDGEQPYDGAVGTPHMRSWYGWGAPTPTAKWFDNNTFNGGANCNRKIRRCNMSALSPACSTLVSHVGWDGASAYREITTTPSWGRDDTIRPTLRHNPGSTSTTYMGMQFEDYDDIIAGTVNEDVEIYTNLDVTNSSIVPTFAADGMWKYTQRTLNRINFAYNSDTDVDMDDTAPNPIIATGYDTIVPTEMEEISGTGMSLADGQVRYAYSFIYDGYQESPLSTDRYDSNFTNSPDNVTGDYFSVEVKFTISYIALEQMSKRITGINLYAARIKDGEETELYRLVQHVQFNQYEMAINSDQTGYEVTVLDYGNRLGSFDAVAGFSETLDNVSVYRSVQCAYQGYVFVGDIHITSTDKKISLDNIIVRSLPFQPSVFDYTSNYAVLPFTATAMAGYNNRLYVFGLEDYAVINPDTMAIEYKSDALGCTSQKFLVTTEFGIFVLFNDNIYAIDGANILPIGNDIKISLYNAATPIVIPSLATMGAIAMHYFKKRNALCVVGKDYVYLYSIPNKRWMLYDIPQVGITVMDVFGSYEDSGNIHICYFKDESKSIKQEAKQSQTLFGNTTLRDIEIEQVINFGDDITKKYIYDTEILPEATSDIVKYDNVTASYPILDKRNTVLYVKRSTGNIDGITLTYRKFVVKEY